MHITLGALACSGGLLSSTSNFSACTIDIALLRLKGLLSSSTKDLPPFHKSDLRGDFEETLKNTVNTPHYIQRTDHAVWSALKKHLTVFGLGCVLEKGCL